MSVLTILVHIVISAHVGASKVNSTDVSPPVLNRIGVSRPLQVEAENPHRCLGPHGSLNGSYCLYVLKGPHQRNGGCLIGSSNLSPYHFATVEIGVGFSDGEPSDVGVWADGRSEKELSLPYGIGVKTILTIPRYSKSGGIRHEHGMALHFPIRMDVHVVVPGGGSIDAGGISNGVAFVSTVGGTHYIRSTTTVLRNDTLNMSVSYHDITIHGVVGGKERLVKRKIYEFNDKV